MKALLIFGLIALLIAAAYPPGPQARREETTRPARQIPGPTALHEP